MFRRFATWTFVAASLSFAGCNLPPMDVWVYVDNSGQEPMVISVDGVEQMTVPPGEVAELKFPPGQHQFVIRAGSETICDLARNLEASDRFGMTRKYLFDPLKNNRYQKYIAQYGESRLGDLLEMSLFSMQKDPDAQRQYIYKQLLKEIELIPTDAWNDISGVEYVLEAPPESIYADGMEKRHVIDRIDAQFYDRIAEAKAKTNPTDEDLESLSDLLDEVLAQSF
jgi:hypothetical protein